ncbi:MAG TPA: VCBS repeat-containing protein, partial [Flavisolibacter sp.]|nr:VCBS repeat-containing protein [Flavisolibacter sp.]
VQQPENSPAYHPRLYVNDSQGNFRLKEGSISDGVRVIAGTVSAGDYDGDGDLDLFIGGRVSHQYPLIPRSFVLQNNKGVFTDVTEKVCAALQRPGMITSSVWTDFDGDHQVDLVIAGEWMPVRFFKNNGGRLTEITAATGPGPMNGMWRSLAAADIDRDGDMDFIAGNLGLNCTYQATPAQPMELYAKDLDGNGSIDPVFFYYIKDESGAKRLFPGISRALFAEQVPAIKKQFLYTSEYAKASFDDIFPGSKKDGLLRLSCNETRSCYFENLGGGKFKKHVLPLEAQVAPVNAIVCDDLDSDGWPDLLLAGNEYQAEVITGRYDASYGCFLKGGANKKFQCVSPATTGFVVDGDVKDMALLPLAGNEKLLLVAVNNDSLKVFRVKQAFRKEN